MSLFKKFTGKKDTNPASAQPESSANPAGGAGANPFAENVVPVPPQPTGPEAAEANMMPMIDAEGRRTMVPRPEWRDRVLLPQLEKVREKPDELAGTIMHALQHGFLTDVVEAAEQLSRIDSNPERGAVILSVVYRELQRFESAETVLREYIEKYGENANVIFNIGLALGARDETERAEQSFWRVLELDPNHRDAFGALLALRGEKGGDEAVQEALARLRALPGNWRALMWQARAALDKKDVDGALAIYREARQLAGEPLPTDLLLQMTADLGHTGHPDVMLKEASSLFDVKAHGLAGAHNLFRACLETGELKAARALLDALFAELRFDWRAQLGRMENDLARVRAAHFSKKPKQENLQVTLVVDEGPVWLPPQSPANELFAAPTGTVPLIAFLGSSAEAVPTGDEAKDARVPDAAARFSRAVPLFLAEQVRFGLQARARMVAPWVAGEMPAFVLGRQSWPAEEAAKHARGMKPGCAWAVTTHIRTEESQWTIEAVVVRASDAAEIGRTSVQLSLEEPETAMRALATDVIGLLQREAGIAPSVVPAEYVVPTGTDFGLYLLCLEQLQTARCHAMPSVPPGTLMGERDLVDASLHLCVREPENIGARLILVELLRMLRSGRPQVVAEYKSRIELLQKEKVLPGAAHAVVQRLFDMLYAAPKASGSWSEA